MQLSIKSILRPLGSRVARNIYLWAIMLFVVIDMNYNNEQIYKYGIIQSRWYWWFLLAGTILQLTLLYVNNLVLAPRFLAKKKYRLYFLFASLLVLTISLCYTFGVKIAGQHFDVDHMQQIGFVSSPVSKDWDIGSLIDDTMTYLIGNVVWVLVFTMAWYMNDYYRQQQLIEAAQKKQTETELDFLKSQINPHFLFNTLNNMYGLALKKADNTPDVILKLSAILRYLLYESNVDKVPFEKEKEIINAYVELELLRITDTKGLHFNVQADRSYTLPPLLWLPVLENIFKHGTRIITDNFYVNFNMSVIDNKLTIHAENTYKQLPDAVEEKHGGIGLDNLYKRLAILYPGKHVVTQQKNAGAYTIHVEVILS